MTQTLCSFYHKYDVPRYGCGGYCSDTKECEPCTCQGNEAMCDFYPERREKANKEKKKMNTAEMWLKAQEDGKMYRSVDLTYSKKTGFVDSRDFKRPWPITAFGSIDRIFQLDNWEEYKYKTMTKLQAEQKLGVKIVG